MQLSFSRSITHNRSSGTTSVHDREVTLQVPLLVRHRGHSRGAGDMFHTQLRSSSETADLFTQMFMEQNMKPTPTRQNGYSQHQTGTSASKDRETPETAPGGSHFGKQFDGFSKNLNMHLHSTDNSTLNICWRDMNTCVFTNTGS